MDNLKKYIKTEHEVVKYVIDLYLAVNLLTPEEEGQLIKMTKPRLENFRKTGVLDTKESIFVEKLAEKEATQIPTKEEVYQIQKMILDDISDDSDASLEKNDEILLTESPRAENKIISDVANRILEPSDDNDIQILDVVYNLKLNPKRYVVTKKDIKQEMQESPLKSTSPVRESPPPPPTPSPTPENLYELCKVEVNEDDTNEKENTDPLSQSNPFCRICYSSFSSNNEQLTHERKVHNNEEDQAALNIDFTTLTIDNFEYSCKVCGLKFMTGNCLNIHMKEKHRMGIKKIMNCKVCNSLVKSVHFKKHMNTHVNGPTKCKLCYKKFASPTGLKCHEVSVHREETEFLDMDITEEMLAFACKKCELKFVSKKILSNHRIQHDQECKLCYKLIKHQPHMDRHLKFQHSGDKDLLERPIAETELIHACNVCSKKFARESILNYHRKIHEAPKNNDECKLCYKTFTTGKMMERHIGYAHKTDTEYPGKEIAESDLEHAHKVCPKKVCPKKIC